LKRVLLFILVLVLAAAGVAAWGWYCITQPYQGFASGGVFRGSFHVGMIGAMHATGLKPDMIVGASVGTLLGAALGLPVWLRAGDPPAVDQSNSTPARVLSTSAVVKLPQLPPPPTPSAARPPVEAA